MKREAREDREWEKRICAQQPQLNADERRLLRTTLNSQVSPNANPHQGFLSCMSREPTRRIDCS